MSSNLQKSLIGFGGLLAAAGVMYAASQPSPAGTGYPQVINNVAQANVVSGAPGQYAGYCDGGLPCALAGTNWATTLDCDLTAQGNISLASDGAYTICGLTWFKFNSTSDSTAMQIVSGSGLVITPTQASNISGSTFTAPAIRIPIVNVISTYNFWMPLRQWIWVSSDNEAANFDSTYVGTFIYTGDAGYVNQVTLGFWKGHANANGWGAEFQILQSNVTSTTTAVPPSTNLIGVASYGQGILGGVTTLYTGLTYDGGWPGTSSLDITAAPAITAASSSAFASSASGANNVNTGNMFLAAERDGSGTAFQTTIARLRVDYLAVQ